MKNALALATSALIAVSAASVASPTYAGDGAAVAAGIGGFATGAIIGSAMAPRPYYYAPAYQSAPVYVEPASAMCIEGREVWSDRYEPYIVQNVRVPC
jgi:hypothetical protein